MPDPESHPSPPHAPLRILLAEDGPVNRMLAMRLLARLGYRADVAANGLEVLAALKRQQYDVVLMDVHMPGMDGLEATRQICRDWPRDRRPRIVAMTASGSGGVEEDRKTCLEAGMDDYLDKPPSLDDLQSALQRQAVALGLGQAVAESSAEPPSDLDREALDRLRALDPDGSAGIVNELIAVFLEDTTTQLAALRKAITARDAEAVALHAHSLKGSSIEMGALGMAAASAELERLGQAGLIGEAESVFPQLATAFDRVQAFLRRVRSGEPPR